MFTPPIKYIAYLGHKSSDWPTIRQVFVRACNTHLKHSAHLHYGWALFEESANQFDSGLQVLDELERRVPNLFETRMNRIQMYRRQGDTAKVDQLFKLALLDYSKCPNTYSAMASKYARFLHKVLHKQSEAVAVLRGAIDNDLQNSSLYLNAVDILYQKQEMDLGQIVSVFDLALENLEDTQERYLMATRKYQLLTDFGENAAETLSALANWFQSSCFVLMPQPNTRLANRQPITDDELTREADKWSGKKKCGKRTSGQSGQRSQPNKKVK